MEDHLTFLEPLHQRPPFPKDDIMDLEYFVRAYPSQSHKCPRVGKGYSVKP